MKKIVLPVILLIIFVNLETIKAQTGSVGIGTSTPNNNTSLEPGSASKGFCLTVCH